MTAELETGRAAGQRSAGRRFGRGGPRRGTGPGSIPHDVIVSNRITEESDNRITETGDLRITE